MAHGWPGTGTCRRLKQNSDGDQGSERQPAYSVVVKDPVSIQAMIAWASPAGPASTRQGSRSARPAPPAYGLDGLPTSRLLCGQAIMACCAQEHPRQCRKEAGWIDAE